MPVSFPDLLSSITNLKYWSNSESIISKTLQILNDLSVGYSSVRKLVKLEAVQFILSNHTVSLASRRRRLPDTSAVAERTLSLPRKLCSNQRHALPIHVLHVARSPAHDRLGGR